MDITPLIGENRQVIQSYGNGGFKVSGVEREGNLVVWPTHVEAWQVSLPLDADSFAMIINSAVPVELLLIGTGMEQLFLPPAIRHLLKSKAIAVESMDTGAACRTYNVLLAEGRQVAAALIAI